MLILYFFRAKFLENRARGKACLLQLGCNPWGAGGGWGEREREKGKRDRKGGRKIQAFIPELTAETGGETASCSCNKADLHSGFTKPTHLWTIQLGK